MYKRAHGAGMVSHYLDTALLSAGADSCSLVAIINSQGLTTMRKFIIRAGVSQIVCAPSPGGGNLPINNLFFDARESELRRVYD